jgi:hypothetical protein
MVSKINVVRKSLKNFKLKPKCSETAGPTTNPTKNSRVDDLLNSLSSDNISIFLTTRAKKIKKNKRPHYIEG